MGKFPTDTCPGHIFIILPGMITPFTFTIIYCHLIAISCGEMGQEITTPFLPKMKKLQNFNPLNFRSVNIPSWCTWCMPFSFTGLFGAIYLWCTWCIHQSPLIPPLTSHYLLGGSPHWAVPPISPPLQTARVRPSPVRGHI